MYTQVKSKKAVSVIVGYVILISFAIVIGIIVYQWMKTYVPKEDINCPDGVSLFIEKYEYTPELLTLYIKNNGKFNIGGYFIYATDSPEKELATIDMTQRILPLTSRISSNRPGIKLGGLTPRNAFEPNDEEPEVYNITDMDGEIYSVEIVPLRWQVEKNRIMTVSCKDAKIREIISHEMPCSPETVEDTCGTAICGTRLNNCNSEVICPPGCSGTDVCTVDGKCVPLAQCTDTCAGRTCGTICGGTETCGTGTCSLDNALSVCDMLTGTCAITGCNANWGDCNGLDPDGCETQLGTNAHCTSCTDVCTAGIQTCTSVSAGCTSCNGVWSGASSEDSDVECDGTPLPAHCLAGCNCANNYISNGTGGCRLDTSNVGSCGSYCALFTGYTNGACLQNPQQCAPGTYIGNVPGADVTFGNSFCNVGNADTCCCYV